MRPDCLGLDPLSRRGVTPANPVVKGGVAAAIVGTAAVLVAVLANPLGIGHGGFGWHQALLLVVGLALATAGTVTALRPASIQPVTLADRSRSALRSVRRLWPFVLVAVAFLGLRLYAFAGVTPLRFPDTAGYEGCAARDVWEVSFYDCLRGWTLPLYYKLVTDETLRIVGQFIISCVAWGYLSVTVARAISRPGLRLIAFAAVLLFGSTLTITLWDGMLLSESLSLSLAALVVGAWLSFVRTESVTSLVLLVAATTLWSFLRPSIEVLVLFTVPFIVIWLTRAGPRRLRWIALVSMVAIFLATTASADSPNPPDKRWVIPLVGVIRIHVLPDREALQYFEDAGMPVKPRLAHVTRTWDPGNDWFANPKPDDWQRWFAMVGGRKVVGPHGYYTAVWPEVPRSRRFQDWLLKHGRETYGGFLLSHPLDALASTWRNREAISSPPTLSNPPHDPGSPSYRYGRDAVPAPIEAALFPQSFTMLTIAFVAVIVLAGAVALRYGASITWWIPAALLVTAIPDAVFVWNTDPNDIERHALLVGVLPRLGLLILFFLVLDVLLRGRFGHSAPGALKGATVTSVDVASSTPPRRDAWPRSRGP